MKTYEKTYNQIITSSVFRLDGKPIDLTEALTQLANEVHTEPDVDWYLGEHTEAPLESLIVAAYWIMTEWHGGQSSPEYAAQCALGTVFNPGMTSAPEEEDNEYPAYEMLNQYYQEKFQAA